MSNEGARHIGGCCDSIHQVRHNADPRNDGAGRTVARQSSKEQVSYLLLQIDIPSPPLQLKMIAQDLLVPQPVKVQMMTRQKHTHTTDLNSFQLYNASF